MKIVRKSCARGAQGAEGIAVVIDVFRAFSCEPFFFHFNAARIILESRKEKAVSLKETHPEWILVGEHNEVPLQGADLGNSPSEILRKGESFFRDRTVIHRTTAGVTGAAAALETADEVLLGSFLTAAATARYIRAKRPDLVTLVAMGERARNPSPEDEACAEALEYLLAGRPYDHLKAVAGILFEPSAQKFIRGGKSYLPGEDPVICLQRDLFDFALIARKEAGEIVVERETSGFRTTCIP